MMIRGSVLSGRLQYQVTSMFVNRFTGTHKPEWSSQPWKDGKPYPLQFKDDWDWLCNTFFEITKQGEIDKRTKFCESNPTWPNNPELRRAV